MNAVGPVQYNGYSWNEKSTLTASERNVFDSAGRTVIYTEFTFTVEGYVTSASVPPTGSNQDDQMDAMRQALMAPAGSLVVLGRGYGNLQVNSGNESAWDVKWGPMPELREWKAIGAVTAWTKWQVKVRMPGCADAVYQKQILEHCWKVTVSIDAGGYTTRTVAGHYRIAVTRTTPDSQSLPDIADAYWIQVANKFPLLNDCIRTTNERVLSEDKAQVDYTLRDEQFKGVNRIPPGAIECKASHTVRTSQTAMIAFDCTITAQYRVMNNVTPLALYDHFKLLVRGRIANGLKNYTIIPRGLTVSEPEIYGDMKVQASYFYQLVLAKPDSSGKLPAGNAFDAIGNLVDASQLWSQPPLSSYQAWKQVFQQGPGQVLGLGAYQVAASDDSIQDLCKPASPTSTGSKLIPAGGVSKPAVGAATNSAGQAVYTDTDFLPPGAQAVPEGGSWLWHDGWTRIVQIDNVVEMKPLPQSSPSGYVSGSGIQTDFDTDPVDQGGANLQTVSQVVENTPSTGPSSIVQRSCDSSFYLYLEGDAIRVGYQIDEPMLTQFGGVTVTPANTEAEYFATKQVGWLFGCPVTRAKWRRRWLCSAPPKGTNIPVIRMPIVGA